MYTHQAHPMNTDGTCKIDFFWKKTIFQISKFPKIQKFLLDPQKRVFVAQSSKGAHFIRNCPYFSFGIKWNFPHNFKHDRKYLIGSRKTRKNFLSPISPFSKSAYWPPEMEKIAIFQKFYSKVKVSTQTHRMSPVWRFYDKNSSLWIRLRFWCFHSKCRVSLQLRDICPQVHKYI